MNGVIKRVGMVFVTTLAAIFAVYILNTRSLISKTNSSTNNVNLKVGEAYRLKAAETLDKAPTYESANPEVAVVDSKTGIVTAKSVGETKVVVKTDDEIVEYVVEVTEELTPIEAKTNIIKNDETDLSNAVITQVAGQLYTGYPITPDVEVVLEERKLENAVDYKVTYGNNTAVGTATIQITGIGNYKGTKVTTFEIYKNEQSEQPQKTVNTKAKITCKNPTYTGINQVIASCDGGQVQNSSQKNIGSYTVTCSGDSSHLNADNKTCSVLKTNVVSLEVASISDQMYTGKPITPKVVVTQGNATLIENTDYKVNYTNNINVGTATIQITGIKNYEGTKTVTFRIVDPSSAKAKAVITCANKTYNGAAQTIAICSGGTVKNASQTKVGSYTVTCTGDSSHIAADSKTCSITTSNISTAVVTKIADQTYTGKSITPNPTVKIGNVVLKKDTDYTLGYGNNVNAGTATMTITGKGNYTGTKQVKFTIVKPAVDKTPAVITCFNKTYNGAPQTIATCSGGTIKNASQSAAASYVTTCTGDSTHLNATNKTCVISPASMANVAISSVAPQKYTGKALTPAITVSYNGKTLNVGTDYVVSYANNVNEGTATITVRGVGNYTGTKQKTFTITKEKTKAAITCSNKVYNGAPQTIATCSGGTVKNASQTKVGNYTVTCAGDSNHLNADNKTCSITKGNVADATLINAIANQTYTGNPITPNPTLSLRNRTLIKDTDYMLSYKNNTSEGIATIIVSGKGNYSGSKTITFKIISPAVITCSNKTYNGTQQTIASCNGGTVKNALQTSAGSYTITCTGDNNHVNATSKTCSINKGKIENATIAAIANQTYTGKAITPTPTVKLGTVTLKKDIDYTVTYSNNTNNGATATVKITGKGNYEGTKSTTFKITSRATITCANKAYNGAAQIIATCTGGTISNASQTKIGSYTVSCAGDSTHSNAANQTCKITKGNISSVTVATIPSQAYTGKAITPTITVKNGNTTLIKGTDYTVSYSNNINKGKATVTITGINNYEGTKTVNFNIVGTVQKITLNNTKLSLASNKTAKLTATITPTDAVDSTLTWSTSNPIIARVDQQGNVTAVKPGTATITVKSKNNITATCTVTVTSSNKTIASYDSSTLKYWIEYVSEPTRTAKHKGVNVSGQQPTYMITHIWVSDPYNQVKTAITPKASSSQSAEYPRKLQKGSTIINNEITSKGYQSKGLVAVNASGMVNHSAGWCSKCPTSYEGTAIMPLQINNGKVIRDSTNTEFATIGSGYVGFVDKYNNLTFRGFSSDLNANKTKRAEITNVGAKNTFGMISPGVIIRDYAIYKTASDSLATRQAVCQIDTNNFILITSHLNGASAESNHNSCGASSDMKCPRIVHGLTISDLQNIMLKYKCRIGFNIDGGGSVSYFYKNSAGSTATRVQVASSERTLADMLYFVEK